MCLCQQGEAWAFIPAVLGLKAADPVYLLARFDSDRLQQRFAPR